MTETNSTSPISAPEAREGSIRIAELIRGLLPAADTPAEEDEIRQRVINTHLRLQRLFAAAAAPGLPEHCEAVATLTGSMLELFIDIILLSGDNDGGELPRRHREFVELQRFRAAHRITEFIEGSAEGMKLDVSEQQKYKETTGGIKEVRKRVAEVWGADNRGKPSYPVHWSGRRCTRVIAHNLGAGYEELYIEAYPMLAWLINTGLSGGELDTAHWAEAFIWCHSVAQLIALESAAAVLRFLGLATRSAALDAAISSLRNNPGKPLSASDAESLIIIDCID